MSRKRVHSSVDQVLALAAQLSPHDQAIVVQRLIEQIARELERLSSPTKQLTLFNEGVQANTESARLVTSQKQLSTPMWSFAPGYEHTDLIAEEATIVYLFDIDQLSAVDGLYSRPVYRQLLQALKTFGLHEDLRVREQVFTLYAGDLMDAAVPGIDGNIFGLAVNTLEERVTEPLREALVDVPGFCGVETGSSAQFLPMFRYDHRYIIEYSEPDLAGTTYTDGSDNYGSGLTIYRRDWLPAENAGKRRSHYGKLRTK